MRGGPAARSFAEERPLRGALAAIGSELIADEVVAVVAESNEGLGARHEVVGRCHVLGAQRICGRPEIPAAPSTGGAADPRFVVARRRPPVGGGRRLLGGDQVQSRWPAGCRRSRTGPGWPPPGPGSSLGRRWRAGRSPAGGCW